MGFGIRRRKPPETANYYLKLWKFTLGRMFFAKKITATYAGAVASTYVAVIYAPDYQAI